MSFATMIDIELLPPKSGKRIPTSEGTRKTMDGPAIGHFKERP